MSPLERGMPHPDPKKRTGKHAVFSSDEQDEEDVEMIIIDDDGDVEEMSIDEDERNRRSLISSDEQDEEDVEKMIIDDGDVEEMNQMDIDGDDERSNARRSRPVGLKARRYQERVDNSRRDRREKTNRRIEKLQENRFSFHPPVPPAVPLNTGEKRKGKCYVSLRS